jgi:vacuolar-type H+-ATPase subunit E/Vma4
LPEQREHKLDRFTSVIRADALNESKKIYEDIRLESESMLTSAEDEALAESFRYIKNEVSRIRGESGRRISKKIMESKRALAKRRAEMGESVLGAVRERLAAFVKTDAYADLLRSLTLRAAQTFAAETVVYLRDEDMPLAGKLAPKNPPCGISFAKGDFILGGIIAACPQKRLQIDESFDTTLGELSERFSELFGPEMRKNEAREKDV